MAYTLKASGLATNLVFCVAVDSDGTIKEFVNTGVNSNKTLGTGVAASVAAATWKSVSRQYFETLANGTFDYYGVRFASGFRPTMDSSTGVSVGYFAALSGAQAGQNQAIMVEGNGSGVGLVERDPTDNKLKDTNGGSLGTTSLPTDNSTKFSWALSHTYGGTNAKFYGLESGSLAADGTNSDAGFGGPQDVYGIGGAAGQGNARMKVHILCGFNIAPTLANFQSLHDDWFGTLFDSGSGPAGAAMSYYSQL